MADSDKSTGDLIDEVISFIEREREVYGDFAINDMPHNSTESQEQKPNTNSEPKENNVAEKAYSSDSTVDDSSHKNNETSSADQQSSDSIDSQEGLFHQDESNEVYHQIDKCSTLEELQSLCRQADVLRTDLKGTQLVFGVGNPNADLVLVGEAPGAEEDKQGEPFVGKAGQLLNEILSAIDFKREDVYIANILKHRPPNNRNPKPEERKRSLPFLLRQIDLIDPKLILSLGKVSAQTLLDKQSSLSSMRGKFHNFRGKYELLATYHPAALLRHAKWKRPTWEDVQLLRERYDELGGKP